MKEPSDRLQATEWIVGIALSIGAIFLHLQWLRQAGALWRDEAATVQFATMPGVSEIWANLAYDNFPPFLLAFLRPWVAFFGRSDEALRWFGFTVGMCSLAAFWGAARLLKGRVPLIVLAVVGLSPLGVYTIDSIRPYGAGICLMSVMTGSFWYMVSSGRLGPAGIAATIGLLALQCLYQNAAFLFALVCAGIVVAVLVGKYRSSWLLVLAGAIPIASLLIHLPHVVSGREWGIVAQSRVSIGYVLGVAWSALKESGFVAAVGTIFATLLLSAYAVVLFVRQRSISPKLVFVLASLWLGVAAYMCLIMQTKLPTQPWYYVIVIAFVTLCLDAACSQSIMARWSRVLVVMLVAITSVFATRERVDLRQTNVDLVAHLIRASATDQDFVIVNPWPLGISWSYYFDGNARWTTIPPLKDVRIHRYDLLKQQMMRNDQAEVLAPIFDRIRDTLKEGHRIWLVGGLPTPTRGVPVHPPAPAPSVDLGWSGLAYGEAWGLNVAAFLQAHAQKYDKIPVPTEANQAVNPLETMSLGVLSGWRD
jgi:hypothetical protein